MYAGADEKCVLSDNQAANESVGSYAGGEIITGASSMAWMGDNTLSFLQLVDQFLPELAIEVTNEDLCPVTCGSGAVSAKDDGWYYDADGKRRGRSNGRTVENEEANRKYSDVNCVEEKEHPKREEKVIPEYERPSESRGKGNSRSRSKGRGHTRGNKNKFISDIGPQTAVFN